MYINISKASTRRLVPDLQDQKNELIYYGFKPY